MSRPSFVGWGTKPAQCPSRQSEMVFLYSFIRKVHRETVFNVELCKECTVVAVSKFDGLNNPTDVSSLVIAIEETK